MSSPEGKEFDQNSTFCFCQVQGRSQGGKAAQVLNEAYKAKDTLVKKATFSLEKRMNRVLALLKGNNNTCN